MAKRNSGEAISITLAAATAVGLIAWTVITHYRFDVATGMLPAPGNWFTAAIPVWAALLTLIVQVVALGWAIVTSTSDQASGIVDEFISYFNFAVPLFILLLCLVGFVKTGPNHINGTLAFLAANFGEMVLTKCAWTVANRRPGGVIGHAA